MLRGLTRLFALFAERGAAMRKPVVEEVEPRILYSADVNPLLWGGVDPNATAIVGAVDSGNTTPQTVDAQQQQQQQQRREIVFVDAAVADAQTLIDGLIAARPPGSAIEVVQLQAGIDGLHQITEVLANEHDLNAIHIVSHGDDALLQLGSTRLDAATLAQRGVEIAGWRSALDADADLVLYGCDVGRGDGGAAFIDHLAQLTGADVAASTDATGATALGGNWVLEAQSGQIESHLLLANHLEQSWNSLLAVTVQGGETRVNTTTTNAQTTSSDGGAVAMDSAGDYVVVWNDANTNSGDVYFQRYNASGVAQGGNVLVNTSTPNLQSESKVAMDANGNFVVVWASANQDGSGDGIYAQRYNASGVAQGGEFRVNTTTANSQNSPTIAMSSSGAFVVAWTDAAADGAGTGVYAQRYNAAGAAQGAQFRVNTTTPGNQGFASAAMDGLGNFVIVWDSDQSGDFNIHAQRYNASGVAQGGEVLVNTTANGTQWNAAAAMDYSGNFVVVWESGTQDSGGTPGIYGQRFNASGVAQGSEFHANTTTADAQLLPAVAMNAGGGFIVAWNSNLQDGSGYGIYTQQYDVSGLALGGEVRVATTTANDQLYPAVGYQGSQAAVVWSGNGTGDTAGVFMQRYSVSTPPAITVTPTAGLATTEAGGTAQFNVVLNSAPTATVTIAVSSSDTGEGTVSTSLLTFTIANWATPQTVTVTGFDDALADGFQSYSIVLAPATSSDGSYNTLDPSDVQVVNADNDITYGLIAVDTTADTADGDTSSLAALAGNRGADGAISLREAIIAANNSANGTSADRITFAIAGTGTHTIDVASALPEITSAVIIDASTDDSFAANGSRPAIILDGNNLAAPGLELSGTADGSTIRGFVIRDFAGDGIAINFGSDGNTIAGNFIGSLLADGSTAGAGERNANAGIYVEGANNIIGGLTPADRNVISGNDLGVYLDGVGATANLVMGNYIGTDATGTSAIGNLGDGVALDNGASGNIVGGSTATARNVISGNLDDGVGLTNGATTGNVIRGNYIGTDATGTLALGNARQGVEIANNANGLLVGGTGAGDGNLIAFNGSNGIRLIGAGNVGIAILGNSILGNSGRGIDLMGDGVTANDASDADTGANNLQNFPLLATARTNGSNQLIVGGTLGSTANSYYRIEFYASASPDGSGHGEGDIFLGFANVATDGSGNATINATLTVNVPVGAAISATATQSNNTYSTFTNTSEFARNVVAVSSTQATLAVTTTADTSDGDTTSISTLLANMGADGAISLREAIIAANNTANGSSADRITFNIAGTGVHTINLQSLLPTITGAVAIDATTDDSFTANGGRPAIVLSGDSNSDGVGDMSDGLMISGSSANGSVVRGLIFQRFTVEGIAITGSNGNTIAGNWFGLDSAGNAAGANNTGINLWNASNNIIGGSTAADRNVVSGSSNLGIAINTNNATSTGNQIRGNYIGTNADGTAAVGNTGQGLWVNAAGNTIGGTAAGQGNVISGTTGWVGITLEAPASGTLIAGNLIGLNAAGTAAIANAGGGIYVVSANNTIGGTTAATRNVISGNGGAGIVLAGAGATGNVVIGNYIGTDAAGTSDVNGSGHVSSHSGVAIIGGASNNRIGTDADGSNDTAERNIVSGNNWYGVEFIGSGTSNNVAQGNYIGTDVTGQVALGNSQGGVSFWNGATNNRLGSGVAGAGNVISANETGVLVANGVTNNRVQGNIIGLAADGSTALGNSGVGVYFYNGGTASLVSGNVIGTDADGSNDAGERNVISANYGGVAMRDAEVTANTVAGNYIGADATGALDRGNTAYGVFLQSGAHANIIGGSLASQRNVISGNDGSGIEIDGETSDDNVLRANWIGVAADGASALGNGGHGIYIAGGGDNTLVGGSGANDGNWIASPSLGGVFVRGDSTGTIIQGNRIGTDLAGTANWGTGQIGILLENGASQTLVGGTAAGASNIVAHAGQGGLFTAGIAVIGTDSTGNVFLANSVYASFGLGIDLGNDGVSANDAGDADSGPNGLLNALTLDAAVTDGSMLFVSGSYIGEPNTYYRIDVFSNTSAEPSGTGEGRTWLGTVNIALDASGALSGSYSFAGAVAAGSYISSTITRTDSTYTSFYETSEFSNHVVATAANVAPAGADGSVNAVEDTAYTFSLSDFGFSDGDGDSPLRVRFDTLPASGTLLWNGSAFAAGDWVDASDIASGLLTYAPAANVNGTAVASFTFRVQDDGGTLGGGADTDASANTIAINVAAVNDAPLVTSNGGGAAAAVNVAEGSSAVTTVTSTDVDGGAADYSIVGGADAGRFTINASTGVLTFLAAPDYEAPTDSGADNVYDVTVQVSDGAGGTDTQAIAVTVTPTNDNSPIITSNGGGATATANVAENQTTVTTVAATDADLPAQTITYSIVGGADAALFTIDASSGALQFVSGHNYEAPTDAGADNVYDVIVQASDGAGGADTQAIAVSVTPVNEASPVITSNGGGTTATISLAENTSTVTTVTATDSDLPAPTLTYSISGGADAARFAINASSGALTFIAAPDYEAPEDVGANNVYDVTVRASDGSRTDTQAIAVTVSNVNEAPVITSGAAINAAENQTTVTTVTSSDVDGGPAVYTIVGGADAGRFTIDAATGVLTFNSAPDFEAPADAGADNIYDVVVQAADANGGIDTQTLAVTVSDVASTLLVTTTSDAADSGIAAGNAAHTAEWLNANRGADGAISLREAIIAANNTAGTDTISFNIAGAGVKTVTVGAAALPTITGAVLIDGWSQGGFSGTPLIELTGNYAGSSLEGLTLGAGSSGSTVRGLIVNRFTGNGIEIDGSGGHTLQGNWIGLDATGTAAAANVENGLYATASSGNLIGGATAAERNVISGNGYRGIHFVDVDGSTIAGNYIGTDAMGTADVNGTVWNLDQSGLVLGLGSDGNVIGGTTAAQRNVISGNNHFGVEFQFGSQNNRLEGNYVGTTVTGMAALGNRSGGVAYWNAGSGNVTGGGAVGAGNVISGNGGIGVLVGNASSGAVIQGNLIGLGADGDTVLANSESGVDVRGASTNTLIGTDANGSNDAAERNVISGNLNNGVAIGVAGSTGTVVAGNFIGTNAAGMAARGNAWNGVSISGGATNNTIGGTAAAAGNVISGNIDDGITIVDSGTSDNTVLGNVIGLNSAQTAVIGNAGQGLWIGVGASGNTIGGTAAGAANIIGGNAFAGITMWGVGTSGNRIIGNIIGTDASGTASFGNGYGVALVAGASNTVVGGTAAGAGNLIANNSSAGIYVDSGSNAHSLLGNMIRDNGGLGIDLNGNGVSANDSGDADSGANGLQNFPQLGSANSVGGDTTIVGSINSTANTALRIEFFSSPTGDALGHGEGAVYLGFVDVTTDASGNASFAHVLTGVSVSAGHLVSATASVDLGSSNYGDTSEFSQNIAATADAPGVNITPIDTTTSESGATGSFSVALNTAPTANVTLSVTNSNNSEGLLSTNFLTFTPTNWNVAQMVTITGADESIVDGDRAYTISVLPFSSTDPAYSSLGVSTLGMVNADNDTQSTIVVTTTSDGADGDTSSLYNLMRNRGADGQISLREAIIAANNTANGSGGADRIHFNIATTGVHTITPLSALPTITNAVIIDASTDDSFTANGSRPAIILDGNNLAADGLVLGATADGSTVRGLVIRDFGSDGIEIQAGSDGNTIAGNYIGALGNAGTDLGSSENNAGNGVRVLGAGNTIGGLVAADQNLVSGNSGHGVHLSGSGATANLVLGNIIGLDRTGSTGIGNDGSGVVLDGGASNNTVGSAGGGRNLVSGNTGFGVWITGAGSDSNLVQNNFVGTDVTGTLDRGNQASGIAIQLGASNNVVGGAAGSLGNLVSGNNEEGVLVESASTSGTLIVGNYIGTTASGNAALPNLYNGIWLRDSVNTTVGGTTAAQRNVIGGDPGAPFDSDGIWVRGGSGHVIQGNYIGVGADGTTALGFRWGGVTLDGTTAAQVGGTATGAGNLIANNHYGINVYSNTSGNAILGNRIFASTELGIEFNFAGTAANDSGDGDSGANDLQNHPVLSSANTAGGNTTVIGSLNSNASTSYRIELFSSATGDGTGYGEGQVYLGFTNVTTDGSGNASIAAVLSGVTVAAGHVISATATVDLGSGNYGSTSQFAANVVVSNAVPSISVGALSGNTTEAGGSATFTVVLDTAPTADVTIAVSSNNTLEGTVSTALLTFTSANWNVAQTVTVTGINETIVDGNRAYTVVLGAASSADSAYNGLNPADVAATNTDNDTQSTIVVTTTSDVSDGDTSSLYNLLANQGADGRISLREAIIAANNSANGSGGADRIHFNIADALVGGAHSINLASALPAITQTLIIDAGTEPDAVGAPVVQLNGLAAGSGVSGLRLEAGSSGSTVRGLAINGFHAGGIVIAAGSDNNLVAGNFIGTDITGTLARPNGRDGLSPGISIYGDGNIIGGLTAADRNVIAGNDSTGVWINANNNVLQGNHIGTDVSGSLALGNVWANVGFALSASGNLVGGTVAGAGNIIAHGTGTGVMVYSPANANNALLGNRIFGHAGLGIDLGNDGVTANDAGDADSGANGMQNFPLLVGANSIGGNTTITGTINSTANTTLRIEFFSASAGDVGGYGEGAVYLGFVDVTTDAVGNASFAALLGGVTVSAGHAVSATATVDLGGGSHGDTSEFSAHVACTNNSAPVHGVPGTQSVNEDTLLAISGLSVGDAQGNLASVQLTVGQGTLSVNLSGGATISSGANGSATLTLAGTQAQINSALATLGYRGDANYFGGDALTVVSTDSLGASDSDTVAITVNAVNDAPLVTSVGAVSVAENQTGVVTVTSSDVDGGASAYSIIGGADASLFTIDSATGALVFNGAPNFEAPADVGGNNVYDVIVQVADGNGGADTQAIAVAVTGVNEAPGNIRPATVALAERAPAGTVVAIVTASDPDAGDLFTFTLVNDGSGRFVVDPSSGRLTVAPGAVLDFETEPSQTLLLRVTDAQGLRTEQSIVVTLSDVVEPPPVLTPSPAPSPVPVPVPSPTPAASPAPDALPIVPPAPTVIREGSGNRGASTLPATRGLVEAALSGSQQQVEADRAAPSRYGQPLRDGAPVIVASVSFVLDGSAVGGWSQAALDGLLAQSPSDTPAQRFGLFSLSGSSIDTDDIGDPSAARNLSPNEALVATLQDPVRVASATLTAGFVWWLTRSGGLLTSILMGIPAWRHVDLLPVLAPRAEDDDEDDDMGEGDQAQPDARDSIADEMFSNTSRLFGESRYLS